MSIPGGVDITGFIAPTSEDDLYATHKAKYGHGSHRSVLDITERNDIKDRRREIGMTVYVQSEDIIYILRGGIENINFEVLIDLNNNSNPSTGLISNFETVYGNLNQYDYNIILETGDKLIKRFIIGESFIDAVIEVINEVTMIVKLINTVNIDNVKTITFTNTGMSVRYTKV